MSSDPQDIEAIYNERIASMSPAERVARSAAMFQWTREQLARQIVRECGEMDTETLKLQVALRLYGSEPEVRALIEDELDRISR